jgi:glycosyltransferase involved in cell wall biosynthesis
MINFLKRCSREAEDWLRYSPLVKRMLTRYLLLRDRTPDGADTQAVARSIARLCSTARLAPDDSAMLRVEERIRERIALLDLAKLDWGELVPKSEGRHISRAAILKPPVSEREKGVVFISFEEEWTKLIRYGDLRAFAERWLLVISPTWCPPHCLSTTAFAHAYPGPIFSLISNTRDLEILPRLAPNYVPVPLFASSWVNPEFYQPLPRDRRDVDIVMLANFGKYKRHIALFRALRKMPADLRVLLMGQDQDTRTADTLREEAACYGVPQQVQIRTNVSNAEVADGLCRARVSLILSRREGSCVAVAESLFADTPVGLLRGAEIGSRAFVNDQTGRFLDERHLASELAAFVAESDRYAARRWAQTNISCHESSRVLSDTLRAHQLAAGQEWTQDLAPLCWRPNPLLVRPEDRQRMRAVRAEFKDRFGLEVGTDE